MKEWLDSSANYIAILLNISTYLIYAISCTLMLYLTFIILRSIFTDYKGTLLGINLKRIMLWSLHVLPHIIPIAIIFTPILVTSHYSDKGLEHLIVKIDEELNTTIPTKIIKSVPIFKEVTEYKKKEYPIYHWRKWAELIPGVKETLEPIKKIVTTTNELASIVHTPKYGGEVRALLDPLKKFISLVQNFTYLLMWFLIIRIGGYVAIRTAHCAGIDIYMKFEFNE